MLIRTLHRITLHQLRLRGERKSRADNALTERQGGEAQPYFLDPQVSAISRSWHATAVVAAFETN